MKLFKQKRTIVEMANNLLDKRQEVLCIKCRLAGVKCKSKVYCLPSEILIDLLYSDERIRNEAFECLYDNLKIDREESLKN